MSKLYNLYLTLKKQNPNTIFLFKSGIFFIAIDKDAYTLSEIFNFKLSNLNDEIVKCGFPCSSFDKYCNLFKIHKLNIKVIEPDNNLIYTVKEYVQSKNVDELLNIINSVDINNLSVSEAYDWIENLKSRANIIINGDIL